MRFAKATAQPTLKKVRRGNSAPPRLRRTGAMFEGGIRRGQPNYVPSTKPFGGGMHTEPTCVPPPFTPKKLLPSEKKVAKQQEFVKKSCNRSLVRVMIPFPPMNAPFGAPSKYDKTSLTKKVHTLVVNFRDENNRPELQNLRKVLSRVEAGLNKLVELFEPTIQIQDHICAENKNTFVHPGSHHEDENGNKLSTRFPDFLQLKIYPEDVEYKTPDGNVLDIDDISLTDYDVQPTVELRDVWQFNNKYYPRLVITACTLYPRDCDELVMLEDWDVPAELANVDSQGSASIVENTLMDI